MLSWDLLWLLLFPALQLVILCVYKASTAFFPFHSKVIISYGKKSDTLRHHWLRFWNNNLLPVLSGDFQVLSKFVHAASFCISGVFTLLFLVQHLIFFRRNALWCSHHYANLVRRIVPTVCSDWYVFDRVLNSLLICPNISCLKHFFGRTQWNVKNANATHSFQRKQI